ncbi:2-C-methyl-D-erythritol 4-phosphate cytidylyltransferase [Vibrio alginolyticus]|uniref:IspD/TarI family cytidylyltransferase n=1 Tax=Vibrio alginolyticus TaxID=663 RepID=UPI00215BAD80|nr:IspD/TarI family cytidylyltransferase [Vibrio alginolyticus]EKL9828090.1 2-C-methyl-D-erythritol 4-phosphate cytidylyltransferase [Vibrio alginolyticus]ELE6589754.1 2-C-methyl-D-erythritol 4-phosphate cytidylyltransferase [Vibrio alginolyticus]MCR9904889.1 2-C-methyl-D-erythritol 4-phosphate cytidylyltransferase [Vibrio alginolyticus]
MSSNVAIIFAGGVGSRMGNKTTPKQFLTLYGKPVIAYTIEHFEENKSIDAIVVVCKEEWIQHLEGIINRYGFKKVQHVVAGGATGQESIYKGLIEAKKYYSLDSIVLLHDGVRPIINQEIIDQNIEAVKIYGSAITSCPPVETFVLIDENSKVRGVHSRDLSRLAKAPQSFFLRDILSAHEQALEDSYTEAIDSCSLMRHYGHEVHLIDGISENIKITTPIDFYIFKSILEVKEQMSIFG